MDQNVSKQKNPAKPTNSPAQKSTTSLVFTPSFYTPRVNLPYLPLARTLICACMLAPARDGKFAKAAKVSWNPGNRRVSSCWLLREGGRFCVVEVVCENHPSIKLIHLFEAQKKKWLDHPKWCEVWLLTTRRITPPRGVASQPSPRKRGTTPHSLPTTS